MNVIALLEHNNRCCENVTHHYHLPKSVLTTKLFQNSQSFWIFPKIPNIPTKFPKFPVEIYHSQNSREFCIPTNDSSKILTTIFPKCKIWVSQVHRTVFFYSLPALNLHQSIHQIARFQFQKYKIFQLLRGGGHIPLTPPWASKWAFDTLTHPHKSHTHTHTHTKAKDGSMPLVRGHL